MSVDTLYLTFLVVGMLIAFMAAVGAVLAGFWLAGRLAGLFGRPVQVDPAHDMAVASGLADRGNGEPNPLEGVPWLDMVGQPTPEDPGEDPEAWQQAPE